MVMTTTATLDRRALRADTPGCRHVTHLNNAGAGLVPAAVTRRMIEHLKLEEEMGGYEAAETVRDEWLSGKSDLARLLGTGAGNLAVVESTTVGFHRVLSTIPLRRGDRVLVASSEYASTVLPLLQLSRRIGLTIEFIPDDADGTTDIEAFRRMLREEVRLVCAVHAPSHNGLVNDVAAMGAAIADSGLEPWFLVDACQSVGQLPVSVKDIRCDFLVASGRKFLRGPRGTGVLVVGDRALNQLDSFPVDVSGATWVHSDDFHIVSGASRYETFERSIAAGLGMMVAARYTMSLGIDVIAPAIERQAEYLRSHIGMLDGWSVLDRGLRRSGIVTARHPQITAEQAVAALRAQRINAHAVATTINPRDLGNEPVLRLSPHVYNSQEELDRALSVIADL